MRISVNSIYHENRAVFKSLFILMACILLCRVTSGLFVGVIALAGIVAFTKNKPGTTMLAYMVLPMLPQINYTLRGSGSMFGILVRVCPIALTAIVLLQSMRRTGRHALPLSVLYLYLVVACASSFDGWCPPVSFLKILNFLVFLLGIHLGMRNLNQYPQELLTIRNGLMAFCIFVIVGSIVVIPFPSIGYSMFVQNMGYYTYIDDAAEFIKEFQGVKLFSGVTCHSQVLGPLTVACVAFVLCDMMFIERRINTLHLTLLCLSPIILYMTRSRMALLGLVFALALIYMYTIPKAKVERRIKSTVRNMFLGLAMLGAIGMVVMEVRDQSITKWLRKTDDLSSDQRDLSEAVTSTRMGLVDSNLADFKRNMLWGTGFQTCEAHKYLYAMGRISMFSAPIEKGVLPMMVLGETGLVGAIVFFLFLCNFYGTCISRRYTCTATMMTIYLFLNMAEASFFSPGGLGGALWVLLLGGGFTMDMMALNFNQHQFSPIRRF